MRYNSISKKRILTISVFFIIAMITTYFIYQNGLLSIDDMRRYVEKAPVWIVVFSLFLLPPLAVPISIFLIATGARFGFVQGVLLASIAIIIHHLIALGISRLLSNPNAKPSRGASLWEKLEAKTSGHSAKLLFLWGITPGLPYSVKLYLPLAMGARPSDYVIWNGLGHVLGALMFIGLGQAIFRESSGFIIIILIAVIMLSIVITLYRKRVNATPIS